MLIIVHARHKVGQNFRKAPIHIPSDLAEDQATQAKNGDGKEKLEDKHVVDIQDENKLEQHIMTHDM